jgi:hypothetical protein
MSSTPTSGNSTPPATGGNNNNEGARRGYRGNRNNNNNTPKQKKVQFKGAAGSDTALYEKTVTVGHNQATQIVDVLEALVTYCGAKGYGRWAESITELNRFDRADFIGTAPSQRSYGKVTKDIFAYTGTGEEDYRIAYDMWKAEYAHTLKAFLEYEKNAAHIFIALKGQFEVVVWDELQHDSRYTTVMATQCPVRLIELLLETCSTNESSTWEPLARLRHIRKSITYMQKPKNAPTAVDTAQYKRHLSVYVRNASRAGGDFVFGTKFYEPFLIDDGETLVSYLGMSAIKKKVYDNQAHDLIVSVLMIEGCKSKVLKTNLKNQFLTGNTDAYPVTASKAFELIDRYEDDTIPTQDSNPGNRDRRSRYKKNNNNNDDGNVAGAHIHEDETQSTKELVLAAVVDNGIIHQNAFEAIATEEEFDDEDLGEVACIIIGDHYYPSVDESSDDDESMAGLQSRSNFDDDLEDDESSAPRDPLNIVLIDGQDDSSYVTNESMDFDEEFSYDDSIRSSEVPSLLSRGSSTSSDCSTVGNNANIETIICETSYVCDTDEDSSAATFSSHDDTIIDNIHQVTADSGATNGFYKHPNITKLRVPIRMEQLVRRYLDDIVLDAPKLTGIMGRPSQNIATMIDIRQRFSGSIQIIRKEDMFLGMSNTRFTLYRLAPYFNRVGIAGGNDTFDTLRDVFNCDIPRTFLYFDPTDDDYQDFPRGRL